MSVYVPLQQEDPDDDTNQKMDKEVQYSGDADEMVSQHISQPQRRKGGLITMPFIIGTLSIYLSILKKSIFQPDRQNILCFFLFERKYSMFYFMFILKL